MPGIGVVARTVRRTVRRTVTRTAGHFDSGGGGVPAETQLTWSNWQTELERVADDNGYADNQEEFHLFSDYIWYDAAAFNLADPGAFNVAITNETLSIADLETYGAAYVP